MQGRCCFVLWVGILACFQAGQSWPGTETSLASLLECVAAIGTKPVSKQFLEAMVGWGGVLTDSVSQCVIANGGCTSRCFEPFVTVNVTAPSRTA